jgi:hypothetical protein
VRKWPQEPEHIDIAVCFDLFEHLHDDEIGVLLFAIREHISPNGFLVFHSFPSEFSHMLSGRLAYRLPLLPIRRIPDEQFSRVVRSYSSLVDAVRILARGGSQREGRSTSRHCNPLTPRRLGGMLARAGFDVPRLWSAELFPDYGRPARWFVSHSIAHRSLFGVAVPSLSTSAWQGSPGQCTKDCGAQSRPVGDLPSNEQQLRGRAQVRDEPRIERE